MSSGTNVEDGKEVGQLTVEQLIVGKHFKLQSKNGKLVVNNGGSAIGVYLDTDISGPVVGTVGLAAEQGKMPYIFLWPPKGYWTDGEIHAPFGLSANGLQVSHPDGSVTILPLKKLAALVKQLAE